MEVVDHHRRVAHDHDAVVEEARHRPEPALGDRVRQVFAHHPAPQQRRHHGVRLERFEQVPRGDSGGHELRDERADPDRERPAIGVDEAVPGHAARHRAVHLDRRAHPRVEGEPLLDHLRGQGDDLLDHERHLVGLERPPQPGLLDEEGVGAVGDDHETGAEIPVRAPGADPNDALPVHEHILHGGPGDQEDPGGLRLLREPSIEGDAQHSERVGRTGVVGDVLVARRDRALGGHEPQPLVDDNPLHRRGLPKLGDNVGEHAAVHDPAHHVLHARPLAPLEQDHAEAAACHRERRGHAAGSRADHDCVELFLGRHGPRFYLMTRAACCTAAVNPAGNSPSHTTPAETIASAAPANPFRNTATPSGASPVTAT